MAVTISISESPNDVWIVQNVAFAAFARIVVERYTRDTELVSGIAIAEAFHGVSLDLVFEEQPDLAIRMRDAFRTVADEVSQGIVPLFEVVADNDRIRGKFSELSQLLRRFHQAPDGTDARSDSPESQPR